MKIVAQCGTIMTTYRIMLSGNNQERSNQRRDNPTLTQPIAQQQLQLDSEITERSQNSTAGDPNPSQQQRTLNSRITAQQRMQIAQAEWAKLFQTRRSKATPDGQRPILLSSQNQRHNCSWGDQMKKKEVSTTRLYSLNFNGLSLDRRGGQFGTLCKITKEIQADVICCQEHNVDTSQPVVRSIVYMP